MRGGSRPSKQGLDSPQAGSNDTQLGALHEPLGGLNASFHLEAEHSAESVEELARPAMAGMTFQTRIVYTCNSGMLFEIASDPQSTLILIVDAHSQGLQTAMEQKRGMRIQAAPQMVEFSGNGLN